MTPPVGGTERHKIHGGKGVDGGVQALERREHRVSLMEACVRVCVLEMGGGNGCTAV